MFGRRNTDANTKEREAAVNKLEDIIFAVLKIAENHVTNEKEINNIEFIKNIVNAAVLMRETDLIMRVISPKMCHYAEQIGKRDEAFFLQESFKQFVKEDSNKQMMNNLINVIKANFNQLDAATKNQIWDYLHEILECVFKYRVNDPSDALFVKAAPAT